MMAKNVLCLSLDNLPQFSSHPPSPPRLKSLLAFPTSRYDMISSEGIWSDFFAAAAILKILTLKPSAAQTNKFLTTSPDQIEEIASSSIEFETSFLF